MKIQRLIQVMVCLIASPAVMVDVQAAEALPGKALYSSCIACHGVSAEGNPAMNAPSLTGQSKRYLIRQLNHFKAGIRGTDARDTLGIQMRAMTAPLTTQQAVEDVASYIASLPTTAPADRLSGDLRKGNNLYHGNCGSCHGAKAQGNPQLKAPRLAGLDGDYLIRQYNNFTLGVRGNHQDDRYGRQMKFMANSLPGENDLRDVVAFIHAQSVE